MTLMPTPSGSRTPRDTVFEDGEARLYRFRRSADAKSLVKPLTPALSPGGEGAPRAAAPVLLVPSMINRWYVLDLRPRASVVEALVKAGLDVFCLDWGAPRDEDRYFSWKDCVDRLARMARRVRRLTGADRLTTLGYCMGATLTAIHASLEPERYAGLVNLLGPIDFSQAGQLGAMTDPRWFDGDAVADAGNVAPQQMQSGFVMLRPTQQLGKWVAQLDKAFDPAFREAFDALEAWANDNVAFPAEAYRTYIAELYQQNRLVKGTHAVGGRLAELSNITCPLLTVTAERDTICPPNAATAINKAARSVNNRVLQVPGGHVGAVVGSKAAQQLYPALIEWMEERTCN